MTALVRAALIDVYDTILQSRFVPRTKELIEPLGIGLDDWLAEWETMREDRDRGRLTVAASFARTLEALGVDPSPACSPSCRGAMPNSPAPTPGCATTPCRSCAGSGPAAC